MKELNILKGIGIISVMMLHILFINIYTPCQWIRCVGFIVLIFFIVPGYEFAGKNVSLRKNYHDNVWVPFVYMLKYYLILAFLYSLIMILTGKMNAIGCIYSTLCEIFTESLIQKIPGMEYPGPRFKQVFSVYWLIRDYILANLLAIPTIKLYMKGKAWKVGTVSFSLVLSAICYVFLPNLPFQLQIIPSFSTLILMGYILKNEKIYLNFLKLQKWQKILISLSLLLLCICISSQLEINHVAAGRFLMNDSSFCSWFFGMVVGGLCIIPCLYGARMLAKNERISVFLTTMGRGAADVNFVHVFLVMSFFQITGIQSGRCFLVPIVVTPELFLQFLISFIFTFCMSYGWLFLHKKMVSIKVKYKKSKKCSVEK